MKSGDVVYLKKIKEPALLIKSWLDKDIMKTCWEVLVNNEIELVFEEEIRCVNETS